MFVILFVPNIFTLFYASDLQGNPFMRISYLLFSMLIWLLPLIFFNFKNYFRLGFLVLLLSPVEIGFVKTTGLPANIGFLESKLKNNTIEYELDNDSLETFLSTADDLIASEIVVEKILETTKKE